MTRPPVTQCGYPVAPRHEPWCTGRKRLTDGCWCFLSAAFGLPKLTARQWRAARRRHVRHVREFDRAYPEGRAFEKDLAKQVAHLNLRARRALALRQQQEAS